MFQRVARELIGAHIRASRGHKRWLVASLSSRRKKAAAGPATRLQPAGPIRGLAFALVQERSARGQTLVEFAFALPLLLIFLLLLVDFGLALDRRQVAQHAVREGARAGAIGAQVAEIRKTTADTMGVEPARIEVCYVNVGGSPYPGDAGDDVRVSADFTYQFTAGGGEMLNAFGVSPPEIAMTPSARMRLERKVTGATACS